MKTDDTKNKLIVEHYKDLESVFLDLKLNKNGDGIFIVAGNLSFTCSHDGKTIKDDYDVEISIPEDYPQNPPTVKETSKKIPRNKDNHVYTSNGTLCLGSPLAVKRTFAQERTLLWYAREQVVRFLFSHSHKQKYGFMPFGELSHGPEGLLEYYKDLFSVHDNWYVLGLLKRLADDNYKGHTICPCGSGQKLRNCHGPILKEIKEYMSPNDYLKEHLCIFEFLNKNEKRNNFREYMPNKVLKKIRRNKRTLKRRM